MPGGRPYASVVRGVTRFDRTQFAPGAALRCAAGVGICLVVGLLTDHVAGGFAAAVGALSVGYASFQGTYRTRAAAMLLAAAGMAVSTCVGALGDKSAWVAAVLVGAWGFIGGMVSALGPTGRVVGLQWVVAMIVVSQFPMTPAQAVGHSLLVLAGGLLQTVLVVAIWPLRRFSLEQRSLAAVYRSLSMYAATAATGGAALPEARPLIVADARLADPHPFARRDVIEAFQELLEEAERIRVSLAGLARDAERLRDAPGAEAIPSLVELTGAAAQALNAIADAIAAGRSPVALGGPRRAIDTAERAVDEVHLRLATVTATGTTSASEAESVQVLAETIDTCRALQGHLRTAVVLAGIPAGVQPGEPPQEDVRETTQPSEDPSPSPAWRRNALTLRANLTLASATFRHALRLGVMLALSTLLYRAAGLPHGYWVSLTVLVVLRPGFTETFARGLARIAGTVLGAGLATALVATIRPSQAVLTVLVLLVAWVAYAILLVNYALFVTAVTALIALLTAFFGLPELAAARDRVADTLLGGALALGAYVAWPTWEAPQLPERLAEFVELQGRYAAAVVRAYADSNAGGDLRAIQAKARLARSNAEASVDRWLAEPAFRRSGDPRTTLGVLAAMQRFSGAAMTLHAHPDHRRLAPREAAGLDDLASELVETCSALALAVRAGTPPQDPSHLRTTQLSAVSREKAGVLTSETNVMLDSIETASGLLAGQ